MEQKYCRPNLDSSRRFRAYNVGIAKTGTQSLAALFRRYKSGHEFMFQETVQLIARQHEGLISDQLFRRHILHRDQVGGLEMDSASINHFYLDILMEEFPEAKFIFTIRDCYSWLNSFLNHVVRFSAMMPAGELMYGRVIVGREFDLTAISSPESVVQRLPEYLDGLLGYWSQSNQRILDLLPKQRSLVLRTHEISGAVEELANFIGVPPDSLDVKVQHVNHASTKFDFLRAMERNLLEEYSVIHCQELMARLFPEFSLDTFLSHSHCCKSESNH